MADTYEVVTTYTFTQLVVAETSERAMLAAEDTQPDLLLTEKLGLVEVDRTASAEPISPAEVVERMFEPAV